MLVFSQNIPSDQIVSKEAQSTSLIPDDVNENVEMHEEAAQYVECEIRSTIQHESGHRADEEQRGRSRSRGNRVEEWSSFIDPSRAEGIAEKEEENCQLPEQFSGNIISVNLSQLFEQAKAAANIDSSYRPDIKAGTLAPEAQGMYLMQDMPDSVMVKPTDNPNQYQGFDGSLWIDVRKIASPFILQQSDEMKARPSTYQDDGIQPDVPNVSSTPPTDNAVPATPAVPSVPAVEAR